MISDNDPFNCLYGKIKKLRGDARVVVLYRRSLKMRLEKLAAQVAAAALGLQRDCGVDIGEAKLSVKGISDLKFEEEKKRQKKYHYYLVTDPGHIEYPEEVDVCLCYYEVRRCSE